MTVVVGSKSYQYRSDPWRNIMHIAPLHSLVLRAAGFSKILSTGTSPMYHITATIVVGSKSYQSGSDPLYRNILHITPQDSFLLRTKRI